MRVSNLESPRSDKPVANQFVIEDGSTEWFQSYRTMIAKKTGATYTISKNYNYSVTTSRYFNQWLRSFGFNDSDIKTLKKWLDKSDFGTMYNLAGRDVTVIYVEEL